MVTDSMRLVMHYIEQGRSPFTDCAEFADPNGAKALYARRREAGAACADHGWVERDSQGCWALTDKGREAKHLWCQP